MTMDTAGPQTAGGVPERWGEFRNAIFRRVAVVFCLALPLILIGVLPLDALYLTGGDEGIELTKAAHLARQGRWPAEVWNDQPLTHTRLYAWLLRLRPDPFGPRCWSVMACGILLFSVWRFTFHLHRDPAVAVAAVVMLAWSPLVLDLSVAAMQEMPATALGMASVGLVVGRDESRGRLRLWLALLAAIAGISIKLTAGLFALAAFLILLRRECHGSAARPLGGGRGVRGFWVYALGVTVGSWLALAVLDGRPMAAHLASHWTALGEARSTPGPESAGPWMHLVRSHPFLAVFFGAGIATLWRDRHSLRESGGDGLLLVIVIVVFQGVIRPWWEYYSLTWWVAAVPIAAKGWVVSLRAARGLPGGAGILEWRGTLRWVCAVGAMLIGLWWGWGWQRQLMAFRNSTRADNSRLLGVLRQHTVVAPGGSVYSVEPIVAFWLGLRVPETLLVVSQKRFLSGDLDPAAIPGEVRRARCDFVVIPQGLDLETLPEWPELLGESYVLVAFAEGREIYVHRRWRPVPLQTRLRW